MSRVFEVVLVFQTVENKVKRCGNIIVMVLIKVLEYARLAEIHTNHLL